MANIRNPDVLFTVFMPDLGGPKVLNKVKQMFRPDLALATAISLDVWLMCGRLTGEGPARNLFVYWTMQAVWVWVTLLPVLLINNMAAPLALAWRAATSSVGFGLKGGTASKK